MIEKSTINWILIGVGIFVLGVIMYNLLQILQQ